MNTFRWVFLKVYCHGKILRSTEVKCEVTEGKLSLLLKHNVIHVLSTYCALIIIPPLKSLKFLKKENYFQTTGFVCSRYVVEKVEKVSKNFTFYYSIETR